MHVHEVALRPHPFAMVLRWILWTVLHTGDKRGNMSLDDCICVL